MSLSTKDQRQRLRLAVAQGWRCYWCGCPMVQWRQRRGGHPPPDMVTIDHLDPRESPERGQHRGELRKVAACNACNHRRGRERHMGIPLDQRRRVAGRFPQGRP